VLAVVHVSEKLSTRHIKCEEITMRRARPPTKTRGPLTKFAGPP